MHSEKAPLAAYWVATSAACRSAGVPCQRSKLATIESIVDPVSGPPTLSNADSCPSTGREVVPHAETMKTRIIVPTVSFLLIKSGMFRYPSVSSY